MIGQLDPKQKRVTVIGAGIAGLLIADALDRAGYEVWLYERAERAGGLIATRATPYGMAEAAAHSLLVNEAARALFDRLGVELTPVHPDSRARYIWRGGKMRKMPLGFFEAIGAFLRAYFVVSRAPVHQSLEEWADRHLGRAAREYLLTPFVRGIYGATPADLELSLAFPALALPRGHSLLSYQLHKFRKGLRRKGARPAMMVPTGGVGALVDALAASLRQRLGERFKLGQAAELPPVGNIVLAVPADEAARFLEKEDAASAQKLRAISYTPIVSVTAFVESVSFDGNPPRGVGVLVPKRESKRRALGVLFNSSAFPGRAKEGFESFTVMLGGEHLALSDAETRALVVDELRALFASDLDVTHVEIHRWPRAIPRYDRVLGEALDQVRLGWCAKPGHILFGNYTGQVSLRGMIETVASGQPPSAL